MIDSEHSTTLPSGNATAVDMSLTGLLAALIENQARIDGAPAGDRARIEEEGNDRRAETEERMFNTPAVGMQGIAVKLRALWPDLTADGSNGGYRYNQTPAANEDLHLQRLWGLIMEAERLADAVQSTAAPHPR